MDKIFLSKEGYEQYLNEINLLKIKFNKNTSEGAEAITSAVGDGWHDNFAYENSIREERKISYELQKMIDNIKNIEILPEMKKTNKNIVNINDIIELRLIYSKDDVEIDKFKLTGNYKTNINKELKEITLNSPLGKAIYLKKINSHTHYYVNNNKIEIEILEKIK